uniref:Uncharacterized protein n=1 Tax=Fagus sylvatica TaxID=28930 RepID=A0A2N9G1A0_FAGSY
MPYEITWLLMPPWLVRPRHAYSLPCGNLIRHAALMANLPRFARLYSFITRFLGQILKAFWCSKWVIWDIVGKLEKSTFQRYKFCMNWSSDGKVMAPGSRVSELFFSRFSGKDSGQTGEATDEPRVASRIRSCSLSYAPELADQIAASWKESAREGGCPLPTSVFDILGVSGKLALPSFLKFLDLQEIELWLERYGPTNRGHQVGNFPIKIPARPGKILAIQEFHVVSERVFFLKVMDFQITLQRVEKNLCANATSLGGKLPMSDFGDLGVVGKLAATFFLKVLGLHRGELGFARYLAISRTKAVQSVFYAGEGVVSQILFLVQSMPQSNLGQTWSNLSKLREICFGPRLEGFLSTVDPCSGPPRLGPGCLVLRAGT